MKHISLNNNNQFYDLEHGHIIARVKDPNSSFQVNQVADYEELWWTQVKLNQASL